MKMNLKLFLFFLIFSFTTLAEQNDEYDFSWLDKDKEIYVLQNRKFRKKNTLQVTGSFGMNVGRAYVDSTTMQARANYFFKEDYGIEIIYAKNSGEFNDLAESVRAQNAIPFTRIVDGYQAAAFIWSPFYSKINIFDKIIYYDWMFSAGYANISTSDNRKEFTVNGASRTLTEETVGGYLVGTSMLFHLTQNFGIRLDWTHLRFNSEFYDKNNNTEDYWFKHSDLTVGLNYKF